MLTAASADGSCSGKSRSNSGVAAVEVLRKREVRRQVVLPAVALGFRTRQSFAAIKLC